MAQLLLGDSCTVTIAHSRTRDLAEVLPPRRYSGGRRARRPEMIRGDWVKPGATVIDVRHQPRAGIRVTRRRRGWWGMAQFESCCRRRGRDLHRCLGGVGPMTIACLLANTADRCCRANGLPEPEGLTGLKRFNLVGSDSHPRRRRVRPESFVPAEIALIFRVPAASSHGLVARTTSGGGRIFTTSPSASEPDARRPAPIRFDLSHLDCQHFAALPASGMSAA